MKILFLLDEFPATSETFIFNQIVGLKKLGIEVEIVATRKNENEILHPEVKKHGLMKIAHFYDAETDFLKRTVKGLKILFVDDYRQFPKYLGAIKLKSLKDLFLASVLLKFDPIPSIIYAHFGTIGLLAARLKEWGVFKGKLVTTFHGYDMSSFLKKSGKMTYELLFQHGNLFLPISEFWKQRLITLGCPEEKIIVHRMGIDIEKYQFTSKTIRKDKCIKLLTVARFVEKKGIDFALKAVSKVNSLEIIRLQYFIIGDGELKSQYKEIIRNKGLEDCVFPLGWKTQDEVKAFMNECHIFILPSVTASNGDMEGIPVSIMEAMASGMPVVSTYHSGIPELVTDGESGLLVPERDVDALAEKLEYLIKNPEIWPEMGRYGRRFVEEHYNINQLNRTLVKILKCF